MTLLSGDAGFSTDRTERRPRWVLLTLPLCTNLKPSNFISSGWARSIPGVLGMHSCLTDRAGQADAIPGQAKCSPHSLLSKAARSRAWVRVDQARLIVTRPPFLCSQRTGEGEGDSFFFGSGVSTPAVAPMYRLILQSLAGAGGGAAGEDWLASNLGVRLMKCSCQSRVSRRNSS